MKLIAYYLNFCKSFFDLSKTILPLNLVGLAYLTTEKTDNSAYLFIQWAVLEPGKIVKLKIKHKNVLFRKKMMNWKLKTFEWKICHKLKTSNHPTNEEGSIEPKNLLKNFIWPFSIIRTSQKVLLNFKRNAKSLYLHL